jgi:hypothetical protein
MGLCLNTITGQYRKFIPRYVIIGADPTKTKTPVYDEQGQLVSETETVIPMSSKVQVGTLTYQDKASRILSDHPTQGEWVKSVADDWNCSALPPADADWTPKDERSRLSEEMIHRAYKQFQIENPEWISDETDQPNQ